MSFSLADHLHEILHEIIGAFERWARLAEHSQILLFNLIQPLLVPDKQPDGRASGKRVETATMERRLKTGRLEGFNMAIDRAL